MDSSDVKALIFDVFGTVVDWRTSITRQGREFGKANGLKADWEAFADAWRSKYRPYMDKVRSGELPWTNLDGLHRMALEDVLGEFEIHGLSEETKAEFNLAWHRLDGWPDSAPGLWRLKRRFTRFSCMVMLISFLTRMMGEKASTTPESWLDIGLNTNGINGETVPIGPAAIADRLPLHIPKQ